jgi:beta-lactamase class A
LYRVQYIGRPVATFELLQKISLFMKKYLSLLLPLCLFSCAPDQPDGRHGESVAKASREVLRSKLQEIIPDTGVKVGVAVLDFDDGDTLTVNGHAEFAQMSVAKFPQAMALLRMVDEGKLRRDTMLYFTGTDLDVRTASPLRKDYPQAAFSLSIPEALKYSIGQSDNITSNKIFNIEGGPGTVEKYVHGLGIGDMYFGTDYAHLSPETYYKNRTTPWAMARLLQHFYQRKPLSDSSTKTLWKAMVEATSGPDRLKAGLPEGTVIGHKTGTSGQDRATGLSVATNDVGIVSLPNGRQYAIAVFVGESRLKPEANAKIIADISKAVWEDRVRKIKSRR